MLQDVDPELVSFLPSIGSHVVEAAMQLLMTACVPQLPAAQVLSLWDRLLGFDTTLIVAAMAAALIQSRYSRMN